ncbi:hypothetical protein HPB47_013894 [Ixodes persulcatus]|uniref:Uncharacterized protein n=1 Tax=Ixodes persulcatus TaxID=34615 RepID=A0AC60R174_IXOPE|nr:hypothetical protein HPB47_013894 [Ixodes persulcatus]
MRATVTRATMVDAGHKERNNSEWLVEKFTSGLTFPSLPYYMDGSVKLTQSLAILRHLAREYDLVGRTAFIELIKDFERAGDAFNVEQA